MENSTNTIKENNERFWLDMTKQGTLRYCHEMLKLSVEFQSKRPDGIAYDDYLVSLDESIMEYMDRVADLTKKGRLDEITEKESPFPRDLQGFIHEEYPNRGKFQPNHIMCKLAMLRDKSNKVNYEFLIEYDIFETDVEIYFGVKAISDSWLTTSEFQNLVISQWKKVEKFGAYINHKHRFKMSNNGNNGTFWPFWWRLGMDCKEELSESIYIIQKFYKDYKRYLDLNELWPNRFDIVSNEIVNSMLIEDDYENLIEKINTDYSDEVSYWFKKVMDRCVEEELLKLKKGEGKNIVFCCTGPVVRIICIVRRFFESAALKKPDWNTKHTPIEALSKVILNKKGRVINSANWRKSPDQIFEHWVNALETLEVWFPNLRK